MWKFYTHHYLMLNNKYYFTFIYKFNINEILIIFNFKKEIYALKALICNKWNSNRWRNIEKKSTIGFPTLFKTLSYHFLKIYIFQMNSLSQSSKVQKDCRTYLKISVLKSFIVPFFGNTFKFFFSVIFFLLEATLNYKHLGTCSILFSKVSANISFIKDLKCLNFDKCVFYCVSYTSFFLCWIIDIFFWNIFWNYDAKFLRILHLNLCKVCIAIL